MGAALTNVQNFTMSKMTKMLTEQFFQNHFKINLHGAIQILYLDYHEENIHVFTNYHCL